VSSVRKRSPLFICQKSFGFFKHPERRAGAKLVTFAVGEEVPAQTVKTRRLVQKGFVKQVEVAEEANA
jgi:hypothetical protein